MHIIEVTGLMFHQQQYPVIAKDIGAMGLLSKNMRIKCLIGGLAGWDTKNSQKLPKTYRTSFSAPDGMFSPEEDFANNVEYFLAESEMMKKDYGEIYKWIEHLFGVQ